MTKVMLAEDDFTMISLLKTLLSLEGFETATLGPQDDFMTVLRRETPNALLLDLHLAQGSGLDFLRQLRADPQFARLAVIMASGSDVREACLEAGANVFLLKPFMPDTLIQALRSQLTA